ncbi:MAG: baseplate J/gp47 family protein [Arenicella sp.]
MTIENRTLGESVEEVRNSFRSNAPNSDAWILPNNFWITATVLGGKIWEIYARVRWLITNSLPDTATGEVLDRWGNIFDVTRKPATYASGFIEFSGVDGLIVPSGTSFRLSNGEQFLSTLDASVTSGIVQVNVKADNAGSKPNSIPGTPISFTSTISGIDLGGVVASGSIIGGADSECDDIYRKRVISRIRKRNRYGTLKDYEDWTKEVPGVTRAWAVRSGNSINVYFMMDNKYPHSSPDPMEVAIVEAYLNDPCRKPACADINVLLPTVKDLDVYIDCVNLTQDQKDTIKQELDAFLLDTADIGEDFFHHEIQKVLGDIDGLGIVIECGKHWFANYSDLYTRSVITYD